MTFHPLVSRWFAETLGEPSAPQRAGWPAIGSGAHTLILAPTGTGKTLAAFLWELDRLIREGRQEPLPNTVRLLYVSPLKALGNDVHRNLELPLSQLRRLFESEGENFPEVRVAVRTGDTPSSQRARMRRKAPHILITTPESLHITLTTEIGRGMFTGVRAVILDEIHALAGSKRGAHLALSLERLEELCDGTPQRIGLSATQRPLDEVARFLGGCELGAGDGEREPVHRPVTVVDCGLVKELELSVQSPVGDLSSPGGTVWPAVAELAAERIRRARSTLVFVNNRAQAERIAARINAHAHEELALPYHGSMSRERRLALEESLKAGALRAVVATSALELGIDIGAVDQVLQLQSPKRVSSGLQRVGRAGHTLGQTSRGTFVPTFPDDLVESVAIVDAMLDGDVEPTVVPRNPLDVLAQIIVAAVSVDDWPVDELYALVQRAYPFSRLPRVVYDGVLDMLAGRYPAELASELEPRITWDRTTSILSGSRASRMMAVISGGTIPDRGLYAVHLPDRTRLGELDEEFVHESRVGDVFQLGSATWRIAAVEHDRVVVTPAPGAPARMPFWHGEYGARSAALGRRVGALRREIAAMDDDEGADERVARRWRCDLAAAATLRGYVSDQRAATGVVPDDGTIVIEHFRDEMGAIRIVIHSVYGGRVNAPWGMALAQRLREVLPDLEVQVQTSDDGIMLRLPDTGAHPPLDTLLDLSPAEAESRVIDEVGSSALFGARFRMSAARALLLPRRNPRRRMPLWLQRLKALDLLDVVRQFPEFPILVETYREALQDAFDMASLRELLAAIAGGAVKVRIVATHQASPFAHGLQFGFVMDWLYGDDTPRAERRAAMLSVDPALLESVMGEDGADPETLAALEEMIARRRGTLERLRARTPEELATLIDRAGDLTDEELRERIAPRADWIRGDPLEALLQHERVLQLRLGGEWRFVLTDSYARYLAAYGSAAARKVRWGPALEERDAADVLHPALRTPVLEPRTARREILARHLGVSGPVTVRELSARYEWPAEEIEEQLRAWEIAGRLVRGRFRPALRETEWCPRRLVERARKRALAALRRQIEPVELGDYSAFLHRWQHVDPRDRLEGVDGLETVLHQLAGAPRPAAGWERDYLPARLRSYDPAWLSRLTSGGKIMWAGEGAPVSGTVELRAIRFVRRGDLALWRDLSDPPPLSESATLLLEVLRARGASFIEDIQRESGSGGVTLRDGLRELAAAGLVTNDTVEALREVVRLRSLPDRPRRDTPDPTRWLPEGFTPSADRPVVQRRPNLRRLPKWKPARATDPPSGWTGRWSLLEVRADDALPADEHAEAIARQWLERYGVVSRDWWKRERPPLPWSMIYRQLTRLEFRGELRRGYFVRGLAGAQFALPAAVELLRAAREESGKDAPVYVMAATDPANVYSLPPAAESSRLTRPRGAGALLVMRAGAVIMSAEGRGRRVQLRERLDEDTVTAGAAALARHLARGARLAGRRDPSIERIDGELATTSTYADAFVAGGWRRGAGNLWVEGERSA
jgi:ATP-dependent helicase Lhr and Lhr-like helicase